jgi:hypothetical protein
VIEQDEDAGSVDGSEMDVNDLSLSFVTAHTSLSPPRSRPRTPPAPKPGSESSSATNSPQTASSMASVASNAASPRTHSPKPPKSPKTPKTPKIPRPPSPKTPQHFITLPNSRPAFKLGTPENRKRWLKVEIAGVDDEVAAHLGLFIRDHNLEYDRFVRRVGKLIQSWVQ